jgi:hypothetical protein
MKMGACILPEGHPHGFSDWRADALTELASDFKAMAKDVHVNEASLGMQRRRRRKTPLCRKRRRTRLRAANILRLAADIPSTSA